MSKTANYTSTLLHGATDYSLDGTDTGVVTFGAPTASSDGFPTFKDQGIIDITQATIAGKVYPLPSDDKFVFAYDGSGIQTKTGADYKTLDYTAYVGTGSFGKAADGAPTLVGDWTKVGSGDLINGFAQDTPSGFVSHFNVTDTMTPGTTLAITVTHAGADPTRAGLAFDGGIAHITFMH